MKSPNHTARFENLRRMLPLLLATLAGCLGRAADAAPNEWTPTALTGVAVTAVAIDPSSSSTLYAGTDAGIFKSVDRGASWASVNTSIQPFKLIVDPHSPSVVYAASRVGILRSDDGGTTWAAASGGLPDHGLSALAMDPESPSTLYVSTAADIFGDLYRTTNRGESWTQIGGPTLPGTPMADLAVDSGSTVFVASSRVTFFGTYGGGVSSSPNGGTGPWKMAQGLPTATFYKLALSPGLPSTLYAATNDALFRSFDGGASWTQADFGLSFSVSALAVDPKSSSIAYAGTGAGVFWTNDGGQSWFPLGLLNQSVYALAVDPSDPTIVYAGTPSGLYMLGRGPGPCVLSPTTLCLNRGRFQVQVSWRTADGRSGAGQAMSMTSDTGYFWFRTPTDVELAVKVLDGTSFNGHFWVFGGALTDVEYTIAVVDTETGQIRGYHNAQGHQASFADTSAFLGGGGSAVQEIPESAEAPVSTTVYLGQVEACAAVPTALCLQGARFQADVAWHTKDGRSGVGHAMPLTSDTGYFWFFNDSNVELVLKVLDGRPVNGHYWVFYGALSDVAYTITVTDTETGVFKTYENPQGHLASNGDTKAF